MPTQRLRALLGELHEELDKSDHVDDESIEMLRGIHDEIEAFVEAEAEHRDAGGLLDRLRHSVRKFEGSHPSLTAVIQRITDTLSGAGF